MGYVISVTKPSNNISIASGSNNINVAQTGTQVTINTNATLVQTKNTADSYKGLWTSGTAYLRGDTVKYNDNLYLAVADVPNNVTNPAAASADYWTLYSVSSTTSTFNTLTVVTSLVARANSAIVLQHADTPATLSVNPSTGAFTVDNPVTSVTGRLHVTGIIEGDKIGASDRVSANNQMVTYGSFDVLSGDDYPEVSYINIGLNPDLLPNNKLAQIVSTVTDLLIDSNTTIYIGQQKTEPTIIRVNGPTFVDHGDLHLVGAGKKLYFPDGTYQTTAATGNGGTSTYTTITVGGVVQAGLDYSGITGDSQQQLDSIDTTKYDTVKYFIKIKDGSNYHISEIVMFYDGTDIDLSQYGIITNAGLLGTFTADVNASNVRLLFTPNGATSMSIKIAKTQMAV